MLPPVTKVIMHSRIEDIVKGHSYFMIEKKLDFYYIKLWKKTDTKFETGKTYFIVLDVRFDKNKTPNFPLILLSENEGVFEIKNNILLDPFNYFEFGEKISWFSFKHNFSKEYLFESKKSQNMFQ